MRRLQLGIDPLSLGGAGRLEASWLSLTGKDPGQSAQQMRFKATGKRLSLSGTYQTSDAGLKEDRTLSAEERALFANGWGGRTRSLTAGYRMGAAGTVTASLLGLRAPGGGLRRQRFSWSGSHGAHLTLDLGRIDAGFDRLQELPEAERKLMAERRGRRWRDLSAGLRLAPWLATEMRWSSDRSLSEGHRSGHGRQQWVLTPARGARLTWSRDSTTLTRGQRSSRTVAQTLQLEQKLDTVSIAAALQTTRTGAEAEARRLSLRLTGAAGRSTRGRLDYSRVRAPRSTEEKGHLELTTGLQALASLKLDGMRRAGERGAETRLSGEARGHLGHLPWRAGFAQVESARSAGRRDLTLVIEPSAPAANPPRRSQLVASFARSEALPPIAGTAGQQRLPEATQALLLMQEHHLGRSLLALGLVGIEAGGEGRGGLAYTLRSRADRPLQLELSRRLVEAGRAGAPLRKREAVLFRPSKGWQLALAREQLTAATGSGLARGDARWFVEVGRRTSRLQWSVGGGHQIGAGGRRAGFATRGHLEGTVARGASLRLTYENYPGLPGPDRLRDRLTWSYQQRLDTRLSIDFQGTRQRRYDSPSSDLNWRLDVKASF